MVTSRPFLRSMQQHWLLHGWMGYLANFFAHREAPPLALVTATAATK